MTDCNAVTLGILAGGQATRLGGLDKAWQPFRGMPLIQRTLAALDTAPAAALASYNGPPATMIQLGLRAVADLRPGFPGPLAGIEALLAACATDWLLIVPVDLREIPHGLPKRLFECAQPAGMGRGVVARDIEGVQPLVSLWPVRRALPAVRLALDQGRASVRRLQDSMHFMQCELGPFRFGNLNTPADFG